VNGRIATISPRIVAIINFDFIGALLFSLLNRNFVCDTKAKLRRKLGIAMKTWVSPRSEATGKNTLRDGISHLVTSLIFAVLFIH